MRLQHRKHVNRFLFLGTVGVMLGLLLLIGVQAGVAIAVQQPAVQQAGTATAAALMKMQSRIFATQTAVALTEQPPTATPAPTGTPRPATSTPRPTSTASPTPTLRPTHTPNPTSTPHPTSTATVPNRLATAAAAAIQATRTASTPTATPQPAPQIEVLASDINLRTGPGTGFPIIGSAARGARYPVTAQAADCAWLQIRREDGEQVWITGAPAYTRLNVACSSVAAATALATPAAAPTNTPAAARPTAAAATVAATPPPPTATPAPASSGPGSIAPLSPPAAAAVSGPVTFAWSPDAPLAPGQVFELVFWNPGQNFNDGRALTAAATTTSLAINVDNLAPGAHQWGVFLAQASPYQRIRFLGHGGTINVTGGGSDSGGDTGGSDAGRDDSGGGGSDDPPEPGGKD